MNRYLIRIAGVFILFTPCSKSDYKSVPGSGYVKSLRRNSFANYRLIGTDQCEQVADIILSGLK